MDNLKKLLKINRRPRHQTGTLIETETAWFLRYYVRDADGNPKRVAKKLANKSEQFRTKADVQPLVDRVLANLNEEVEKPTGAQTLTDFVEYKYLPWVESTKAPATAYGYKRLWEARWKPHIGGVALVNLKTEDLTRILTDLATKGLADKALSHTKWFLSGVYVYAAAIGAVPATFNPVPAAKALCKVRRAKKQKAYTPVEAKQILGILEPLDIRAAVAFAIAYFTGLRPSEIRGLRWDDIDEAGELHVRRSHWRGHEGDLKTEASEGTIPVIIEPLKSLLDKLAGYYGNRDGYILQNLAHKPLSLDSLNVRVVAPAMEKAGIEWRGWYAGRRGINSLVLDITDNAQTSSGLLRNNTVTALRHYSQASKDSKRDALRQVEVLFASEETVQ